MSLSLDIHELGSLLNALQMVSGKRVTLIDLHDNVLLSSGVLCDFCRIIHELDGCHEYCPQSDLQAVKHVCQTGEVYEYRCHAGLCEVIIPIRENEQTIACLMVGQYLDDSPLEEQWKLVKACCQDRYDISKLEAAFYQLPQFDRETIQAYSKILTTFASYIHLKKLIGNNRSSIAKQLDDYINEHLCENLTLHLISMELGICKTTLCRVAAENLHGSVFQIIKDRRMNLAKKLLEESDISIAQIAERVGYSDVSYFSRIFSATFKCSPARYRKEHRKAEEKTNAAILRSP